MEKVLYIILMVQYMKEILKKALEVGAITKVEYNKSIHISKKDSSLKIIHPSDNDFYEACREKLGWSLDITAKKNHQT